VDLDEHFASASFGTGSSRFSARWADRSVDHGGASWLGYLPCQLFSFVSFSCAGQMMRPLLGLLIGQGVLVLNHFSMSTRDVSMAAPGSA
jgi:hypothetical protein